MRNIRIPFVSLLSFCAFFSIPADAQETGDSIDTYQNQTVTTEVFVQGRDVLTSNNVTVNSTGHLIMTAPNGVKITGNFVVQLGGRLELNGGRQHHIRYTYDASGNRIARIRTN